MIDPQWFLEARDYQLLHAEEKGLTAGKGSDFSALLWVVLLLWSEQFIHSSVGGAC